MPKMIERLPELLEERLEHIKIIEENFKDTKKDIKGGASTSLAGSLRFIGVATYCLEGNIEIFKKNLRESASLEYNLFLRYDAGEPIAPSYVTMMAYQYLFDALAAGDFEIAVKFATIMGGRKKIEKQNDHPFDLNLGYALKSFVMQDQENMEKWSQSFSEQCNKKGNHRFFGYANMFLAMLQKDSTKAREALEQLIEGHIKLSRRSPIFKDSEDEVLCVWGLGMVNLARYLGLDVPSHPPLIPEDLIYQA